MLKARELTEQTLAFVRCKFWSSWVPDLRGVGNRGVRAEVANGVRDALAAALRTPVVQCPAERAQGLSTACAAERVRWRPAWHTGCLAPHACRRPVGCQAGSARTSVLLPSSACVSFRVSRSAACGATLVLMMLLYDSLPGRRAVPSVRRRIPTRARARPAICIRACGEPTATRDVQTPDSHSACAMWIVIHRFAFAGFGRPRRPGWRRVQRQRS